MARKFLYVFAALIVLALGASLVYRLWGQRLIEAAMVPRAAFKPLPPLPANAYRDRDDMWLASPKKAENPALWRPTGHPVQPDAGPTIPTFFVHPTSYMAPFNKAQWNMPPDDAVSETMAQRFLTTQASALNGVGLIYAPRYRQAHVGAFLTIRPQGARAFDAAYADVALAFETFLKAHPGGPILLAGHSQGSLHLLRLLHEKVAGTSVADRIVAVYAIGWPVSLTADLPALGLPACSARGQSGCILSWQSFGEPADPAALLATYDGGTGFTGKPRRGTPMLCVNPLTGTRNGAAAASQNLGMLDERDPDALPAGLIKGAAPARCDKRGLLLIGDPPTLGPYALPGNNYHVYDYGLFWANIRRDVHERLATFLKHP